MACVKQACWHFQCADAVEKPALASTVLAQQAAVSDPHHAAYALSPQAVLPLKCSRPVQALPCAWHRAFPVTVQSEFVGVMQVAAGVTCTAAPVAAQYEHDLPRPGRHTSPRSPPVSHPSPPSTSPLPHAAVPAGAQVQVAEAFGLNPAWPSMLDEQQPCWLGPQHTA